MLLTTKHGLRKAAPGLVPGHSHCRFRCQDKADSILASADNAATTASAAVAAACRPSRKFHAESVMCMPDAAGLT